jgi:hypothetical protein
VVGLVVFVLAAAGCVFAVFLIVQLAGDTAVIRTAVRAQGRRWTPPRLAVPHLGLVASKFAGPSWITWPTRAQAARFVEHAAWGAVVDLVDRGVLRAGPAPAIVALPPIWRDANSFGLEPGLAGRDARIASAGLMAEHNGTVNVVRIVERVSTDDKLWNEVVGELVTAGLHHPLKQPGRRVLIGAMLVLIAVVTVYWQIFAGAGTGEPAWLRWLVGLFAPPLCLVGALATDAVITALERRAGIRLLKLARKGIGYDYPARAGIVVALDGIDALTRTHPELARRLDIRQRRSHATPPPRSLHDVLLDE